MFRTAVSVPVLIALAASAVAAQTQDVPPRGSLLKSGLLGPGIEMGHTLKSLLLERSSVQEEIKLTKDQAAQLKKVRDKIEPLMRKRFQERAAYLKEVRSQSQNDPQAYEAALQEVRQKSAAENALLTRDDERPLMEVLNSHQRTRLEQIQLQGEGPLAFTRPQVQERLNLSPEQIQAIGEVLAEGSEMIKKAAEIPAGFLPEGRPTSPEERKSLLESKAAKSEIEKGREAVIKARRSTMQMIGKLLTRKQREKFEAMLGEPFDFTRMQPPAAPGTPESKQKEESKSSSN